MISELRIEANKACNFHCDHCYTEKVGATRLPIETFEKLIEKCADRGVANLSITGGEPLLPVDLARTRRLIEVAVERGMQVRLNTNGFYLNASLAEGLRRAGLHEVQISLSSASAEWFDAFTHHQGAMQHVLNAIKSAKSVGLFVTVRFTLMSDNYSQLLPAFKLVSSMGIDKFKVRTVVQVNGISDSALAESRPQLRMVLQELQHVAAGSPIVLAVADDGLDAVLPEMEKNRLMCKCGSEALFIGSDGAISPCPFLREDLRFGLGNIASDDFFAVLENSDILAAFIGNDREPGCGNCCSTQCRASQLQNVDLVRVSRNEAAHCCT